MTAAPTAWLPERDQAILRDLERVRLLTGNQLERLHFAGITTLNARGSARRRSLQRLERLGLVTTLPRRVGGERAGSAGLVYALDAAAHRHAQDFGLDQQSDGRVRRPWPIGWPFVCHTLDVSELHVRLRERDRAGELVLQSFVAEPASWYASSTGVLKPDAFLIYTVDGWEQHRWIEVDRATESLPTLRRKLLRYVELVDNGDTGPAGVLPRVLVTVPTERRLNAVRELVTRELVAPADFFRVGLFAEQLQPGRPPP